MNLRRELDNVIRVIDGSQPIDVTGALAAMQAIVDELQRCPICGTRTMVEDWQDSGLHQMHCIHCHAHN